MAPTPVARVFGLVFMLASLVVIALMFASFTLGAYLVFNTDFGSSISLPLRMIPLFILGVPFYIPLRVTLGQLFMGLWTLYLAFFAVAATEPRGLIRELGRWRREGIPIPRNTLLAVASGFSALLVATTTIEMVQEWAGIPTGSLPEEEPLLMFVFITLAPIIEELGFRLSIIGLIAYLSVAGRSNFLKALPILWHPEHYAKRLLDRAAWPRFLRGVYLAIAFSGIFFGVAHIIYGEGWEVGKVTTASLAGVVMGYLYFKYGWAAPLLLHWAFNYFSATYYHLAESVGLELLTNIFESTLLVAGVISLSALTARLYLRRAKPPTPAPS
jgi:hypothetical protein